MWWVYGSLYGSEDMGLETVMGNLGCREIRGGDLRKEKKGVEILGNVIQHKKKDSSLVECF